MNRKNAIFIYIRNNLPRLLGRTLPRHQISAATDARMHNLMDDLVAKEETALFRPIIFKPVFVVPSLCLLLMISIGLFALFQYSISLPIKIVNQSGIVEINHGTEKRPLTNKFSIKKDSVITTGTSSQLGLQFPGDHSLAMQENCRIIINSVSHNSIVVSLTQGMALFSFVHGLDSQYLVNAGSYQVTVTGTQFWISVADPEDIQVRVTDGEVLVTSEFNEEFFASVRSGEQLQIKDGIPEFIKQDKAPHEQIDEVEQNGDVLTRIYDFSIDKTSVLKGLTASNDNLLIFGSRSFALLHNHKEVYLHTFNQDKKTYIQSPPLIFDDSIVFNSAGREMLIYDMLKGIEKERIKTRGLVLANQSPCIYGSIALIPLSEGIFEYDLKRSILKSQPRIKILSPLMPAVVQDLLITSSLGSKQIETYTTANTIAWNKQFNSKVKYIRNTDAAIIIILDTGTIHVLDTKGSEIKTASTSMNTDIAPLILGNRLIFADRQNKINQLNLQSGISQTHTDSSKLDNIVSISYSHTTKSIYIMTESGAVYIKKGRI
jgi:hypothetical protein